MFKINENYLKLPGSYLFSTIAKKVSAYSAANPDKEIIRLGIGDVTLPLAPVVIDSLHNAVDEMGKAETFHGYAPDLGYEFLRNAIVEHDYKKRGADISADEIFVSDGAKSDSGNIGDIFSVDNKIAVCDPVYPVYVDTNAMAGRTGDYIPEQQKWSNVIYMPCTAETNFAPELPKETPDIIYLCFPNNPTGSTITKDELQRWVDYANKVGAVIIYDAAYEAYISEENVPHTIYECKGARTCAIELRSFSKNAGFTGTRLGFTVIPKDLKSGDVMLHSLWARRHGTKFNGAPYIIQRAGEAVYTEEGQKQTGEQIAYYKNNADNTNEYSFTVRDVVIKTVRLQVAEVLGEYNMQADNIDVTVSDVASGDYGDMTVEKVVIHINRLKKSDIDTLKEKISAKTGIDVGSIYIK